jgi:hypothetical protein
LGGAEPPPQPLHLAPVSRRLRPGYLLAEALCALALAGLLAAAAAMLLSGARRSLHASERRDRADRAERETLAILRESLAGADGIILRGDTAVDFDLLIGTGIVCDRETAAIVLPPPTVRSGLPLTVVTQPLGPEDVVAIRTSAITDDEEVWWIGVVDSAQVRPLPGVCDPASGWRSAADEDAPLVRLTLRDPLPPDAEVGAPVRLGRRGRFTLYHAGGGDWMLGWRRCHPWLDLCGAVQPIAGPLRPPSAGGLRLEWAGNPVGLAVLATGAAGGRGARGVIYP